MTYTDIEPLIISGWDWVIVSFRRDSIAMKPFFSDNAETTPAS